ncbi:unnamed protein product [Ceutorhynchus assimilis]|uniref:FHA domain-containing protein n=1 Tax=Ceutorhynchus assimilis TaxID=467358 RepID=A0A9N9MG00_9CUCU|nr:unnamed protein product [Ceutorhynchus assimilis]
MEYLWYQSAAKWSLRQVFTKSIIQLESLAETDVGRSKKAGLYLESTYLPPQHAVFVVDVNGNLMLRDLVTALGTFVHGIALPSGGNQVLAHQAHGDIVSFGLAHWREATPTFLKMCFFEVIASL